MNKPTHSPVLYLPLLLSLLMAGGWLLGWAEPFRRADAGYQYNFPADHAAHPDFKTEWWYYTGHLLTEDRRKYGYELTFFRVGVEPGESKTPWDTKTVYAAHFAVTDENGKTFHYTEKLNRPGLGIAGARSDAYYVWNELWFAELLGQQHILRASSEDFEIHLTLRPEKPPVIHGINGISRKATCEGCASHYYSMTRLATEGLLLTKAKDGSQKAQRVSGLSWMDHEFGSNQLTDAQTGWDWFSVQLDNDTELMLYLLRHQDGTLDPNSSGTLVEADGGSRHLKLADFNVKVLDRWKSPKTNAVYPMGWQVDVPSEQLRLSIQPVMPDQELATEQSTAVTYWEGSARVEGRMRGKPVTGESYVEMTGYAEVFRQKI